MPNRGGFGMGFSGTPITESRGFGFFPPKNTEGKIPKKPKSPGLGFFRTKLMYNRPINAQLNFQEQKVTVFSGFFWLFQFFLFRWFSTFFWISGIFWDFPKSLGFSKIPGIFRDWDPTLFGKNPMGFKILWDPMGGSYGGSYGGILSYGILWGI